MSETLAGIKLVADEVVPPDEAWLLGPPIRRTFLTRTGMRTVEDRPLLGKIVNLAPLPPREAEPGTEGS